MAMRTQTRITGADIQVQGGEAFVVVCIELPARDAVQPVLHYMLPSVDLPMFFEFMRVETFEQLKNRLVVVETEDDGSPRRLVGPVIKFVPLVQKDDGINWQ